ncbi:MAG: SIS domain-containing protein [Deltaproteobacteria bacterium]|nr:SIS domain-containing protein [Deltaproteobacteria bacterium]
MIVEQSADTMEAIARHLIGVFRAHGKLLLCGCGGSAADTQHIAGELVNRFRFDRPALPAVALTTDASVLTCVANDIAFESVFSRQVEALGRQGDALLAISTSGRSPVVLRALETARTIGMTAIGFTGVGGDVPMRPLCDFLLIAPTPDTARIQECHQFCYHVICAEIESGLFPDGAK